MTRSWLITLGGLLGLYLLGAGTIWPIVQDVGLYEASKEWVETVGTIRSQTYHEKIESEYTDALSVEYEYLVNGSTYVGNRVAFGLVPDSWDATKRRVQSHVGASVTVHYDPNDPSRSTLYRVLTAGSIGDVIAALAFSIAPIIATLVLISSYISARLVREYREDNDP